MATVAQILKALSTVNDPEIHRDLVSLNMIADVQVEGANATFTVVLTTPACPLKDRIKADCEEAIFRLVPEIRDVTISWSSKVPVSLEPTSVPGIKHAIAIGSGKGGVGKSTTTVNLALALAETGAKVGVLDADIYGPSIPFMLGITEKPLIRNEKMMPVEKYGLKVMSIGFLLANPDDPVIWRGPMLGGVLKQFVRDVDWGDIDYLLIDLPPGTGDVQLSLSQELPLSGVVIVVTPQLIAQQIGMKTFRMFQMLPSKAPILGLIENMSSFVCPNCEHSTPIFAAGGATRTAEQTSVPLLGEIPLDPKIRLGGDEGKPVFVAEPHSAQAQSYRAIAGKMAARVSTLHFSRIELPVLK